MLDASWARPARQAFALLLMATVAVPAATAWSIAPPPGQAPESAVPASWAAWTTDLAPRLPRASADAFPGDAAGALVAAVGCALGDVTGDGLADLLVLVQDPTSGLQTLQALAGPDFVSVVWEKVSTVTQILQCAPDLDLDGLLDPIVHTIGETTGTAVAGVADQAAGTVQQVLDGASGVAMVGRIATDAVTGAALPLAGSTVGAAQQATSALLPAAAGAAAFLQTSATTAALPIPAGLPLPLPPLPIDALTATLTSAAELQILDAAGAVVATISIDEAGVNPLALAPVPLTGGLPDVAVLTEALAPVQQAAAGVPQLALYAADGTLSWATELPASTGLPLLLPQAGDLNLDGVGDLIVSTVQQGVEQVPGAAYQVLSGIDGSVLLESGAAVTGLLTALPLGQLPGGAALLQVANVEGASQLVLSALDGAGSVLWSIDVAALAEPVNAVLDAHTGDLTGFTDLTGDAIPDVAVAVHEGAGLAVQAIDGLTGEVVLDTVVAGADTIVPIAASVLPAAAGAAVGSGLALAEGGVETVTSGATSALLAVGTTGTEATMTLIEPVTGAVQWVATAAVPPGAELASISAQAAGDLDGDGVQDLLVTANFNGSVAGGGAAALRSAPWLAATSASSRGEGSPGSVTAVSGATGESLYSASAAPGVAELDFASDAETAGEEAEEDGDGNGVPAPGLVPLLLAIAVAGAIALRRRR